MEEESEHESNVCSECGDDILYPDRVIVLFDTNMNPGSPILTATPDLFCCKEHARDFLAEEIESAGRRATDGA